MRVSKKVLAVAEALAFVAGALVFWQILRLSGMAAFRQAWDAAGPKLAVVFSLYPFMAAWDTASWKNLFTGSRRPGFISLFWIRLAGEAVNNITPGVDVGGEPLKVKWLSDRHGLPASEAASTAILAKTSMLLSEGVFVWIGVAAAWAFLPWPSSGARAGFVLAAAIVAAVVGAIFLFQRTALFKGWSPSTRDFYKNFMPRFSVSIFLNLIGWLMGCVELWAFAWILGVELEWRQALILESLVQLVRTASFFIPGNVGTQEAGYVFLVKLMGFDPALGMALSLLKRARQIAWTAAGFGVWAVFKMQLHASVTEKKPQAVLDTALDRLIHRPPARYLANCLAKTPLTPNAVTLFSLVPAFLAAAALATGEALPALAGLAGFYAWTVLDHTDGELARLKHMQSAWGRVLDDTCDLIASTVMLLGLWAGLLHYWNGHDRQILERLFYPALIFNTVAALLALAVRREKTASKARHSLLDYLAGREPFYFCLFLAIAAFATGHPWIYAFLGAFLIIGQSVLFLISLVSFVRMGRTISETSGG